ncbi:MAG: hypothetical protein O9327_05060 [Polaromonas sp.]|nr:hypothetical protein [Polaromonas sp.]
MKLRTKSWAAIGALAIATSAVAQADANPASAWKPLQCPSGGKVEPILLAPEASASASKAPAGLVEVGRLIAFMRTAGVNTTIPAAPAHKEAVAKISRILQGGSFVGSKMALDEAVATIPGFKATEFATDFEWFLRAMSQPVPHASYPTSVRAEGETWVKPPSESDDGHTHGFDLEQASSSLNEINRRLLVANRALKDQIGERAVLDYLLGYGFNDGLAVRVASSRLCHLGRSKKWSADVMQRIDVAARFMAMPAAASTPPPIPVRQPGLQASAAKAKPTPDSQIKGLQR